MEIVQEGKRTFIWLHKEDYPYIEEIKQEYKLNKKHQK